MRPLLEPDQEALLQELVNASHGVPREKQLFLMRARALGHDRVDVLNKALHRPLSVLEHDVDELLRAGLLRRVRMSGSKGSGTWFVVSPAGREHFAQIKQRAGEPVERVEAEIRRLLDSDGFRESFEAAHAKWSDAEALLWKADSERELSTIGHKIREATQDFANTLVEQHQPPNAHASAAAVTSRLRAVVDMYRPQLGKRRSAMLDALVAYWSASVDVIQRQEHGEQKGNEPLTWLDAWRVVLHTAVLMVEIAATLEDVDADPVAYLEPPR